MKVGYGEVDAPLVVGLGRLPLCYMGATCDRLGCISGIFGGGDEPNSHICDCGRTPCTTALQRNFSLFICRAKWIDVTSLVWTSKAAAQKLTYTLKF